MYLGIFPYLEDIPEDIPDHPDLPDGHHDVWHHYHSTTFRLRIPKVYDTWVFVAIIAIRVGDEKFDEGGGGEEGEGGIRFYIVRLVCCAGF